MTLKVIPYLMMNGNAKDVIRFYEKALDATVLFKQTFGEGPEDSEMIKDIKDHIAHCVLKIGETELMVADALPEQQHHKGNRVTVCITTDEMEKAKQMYDSLQEDGQVDFSLQEMYFSPAYGMVTDKFGVTFQIFTERQM